MIWPNILDGLVLPYGSSRTFLGSVRGMMTRGLSRLSTFADRGHGSIGLEITNFVSKLASHVETWYMLYHWLLVTGGLGPATSSLKYYGYRCCFSLWVSAVPLEVYQSNTPHLWNSQTHKILKLNYNCRCAPGWFCRYTTDSLVYRHLRTAIANSGHPSSRSRVFQDSVFSIYYHLVI